MNPVRKVIIILASLSLAACTPVSTMRNVVEPAASWDFIQTTGGLSLGQPRVVDTIFWLPISMDLSGNRQITVAPTLNNSGRRCIRAELAPASRFRSPVGYYDLNLRVYTGPEDQRSEGSCDEVALFTGALKPPFVASRNMKFRIWYQDYAFSRHYIGEVSL